MRNLENEKSVEGQIEVTYVPTSIQQADIFKKPLTGIEAKIAETALRITNFNTGK